MVSGNPGSGFEDLASLLVDEFDALQIAVECVSDESFHEEAFGPPGSTSLPRLPTVTGGRLLLQDVQTRCRTAY